MSQSIQEQIKSALKEKNFSDESVEQFCKLVKCETMDDFEAALRLFNLKESPAVTKEQFAKMTLGEKNELYINHPEVYKALTGR